MVIENALLSHIHFIVSTKDIQQSILLKLFKMVSFKIYHNTFLPKT